MFRAEILTYSPPALPSGATSHSQCVTFVLELQKIFVLLLKSDRMYIDPSPAILVSSELVLASLLDGGVVSEEKWQGKARY